MSVKFFKCEHCGNVIQKVVDSKVPVVCCGEKMKELTVNTVDASVEKHLPVVTRLNDCRIKVEVGAVPHPMTEEHYISWVYLVTDKGTQRKELSPSSEPCVSFALNGEKPVSVYAYCNLHGLWKSDF